MPAYVVHPLDRQDDHVVSALGIMRGIAAAQTKPPVAVRSARKRS